MGFVLAERIGFPGSIVVQDNGVIGGRPAF
jgi:hypothetical protein